MKSLNSTFLVNKNNLFETRFSNESFLISKKDKLILKMESYALTSNNITYAVLGEKLGYWNFFPVNKPYGIIPVWGLAKVVFSIYENISIGDRYYGYFPMSTYIKLNPERITSYGFTDGSSHRKLLPSVYNNYANVSQMVEEKIEYHPIIKPLFLTSFLNYYFLKDENFFNAEQIILTSASSKTALSLAYLLNENQSKDKKNIIGITSKKNFEFVETVKFYDQVVSYSDIKSEIKKNKSLIIDFSGNSDFLNKISNYLGCLLKYICLIGLADWSSKMDFKTLSNAKFFFAPDHAEKRYKLMGVKETTLLGATKMEDFINVIKSWMKLTYIRDSKALEKIYIEILKGNLDPTKGYLVRL